MIGLRNKKTNFKLCTLILRHVLVSSTVNLCKQISSHSEGSDLDPKCLVLWHSNGIPERTFEKRKS